MRCIVAAFLRSRRPGRGARAAFAALSAASRSGASAPERLEGTDTGLSWGVVGS